MADFHLKVGDREPDLVAKLLDGDGNAENLTGASVQFGMRLETSTAAKVDAAATVTDAADGIVTYSWAAADVDTPGRFDAEFVVTLPSGEEKTFPNDRYLDILIIDDIT